MANRYTYLTSEASGVLSRDPASNTYTIEEGVLVDSKSEIQRNDRLTRLAREIDLTGAPEFRGGGCTADVDTRVHVRYTTPRKKARA